MKMYSAQEFQNVIGLLSNDPANSAAYAALMAMMAEQKVSREPYTFPVVFSNLAAGATNIQGSFLVDASSPFMLVQQNYSCAPYPVTVMTQATRIIPNVNVAIQEASSNRNWQSAAVPVASIFGTGENPWFLPQPRLIPANTTVNLLVTSIESAQVMNLYLSFIGFRLYA